MADEPVKKTFNWVRSSSRAWATRTRKRPAPSRPTIRRRRAAEVLPEANRRTIVATVVASHGCAAGFKLGDTIEVSGAGVVKSCNVCIYAVAPMTIHAAMAHDRLGRGLDPNDMRSSTTSAARTLVSATVAGAKCRSRSR